MNRKQLLLREAESLRKLGSIFTKYQEELDDKADMLEEEADVKFKEKKTKEVTK